MTCNVCYESYHPIHSKPITIVPCGHDLCEVCINQWLVDNNSCPICRQRVVNTMINRGLLEICSTSIDSDTNITIQDFKHNIDLNNNTTKRDHEILHDLMAKNFVPVVLSIAADVKCLFLYFIAVSIFFFLDS